VKIYFLFSALSKRDNMKTNFIAEGAEAKIFFSKIFGKKYILKKRIPKLYRAKELDKSILSRRIKSEVRNLSLAKNAKVNCPFVYYSDNYNILMEYIPYIEAKSIVKSNPTILKNIANDVFKLHRNNIIHGDLTLCNILFDPHRKIPYFIDFGLSFVSTKLEDKATDLEVLREITVADFGLKYWAVFEKEYQKESPEVIKYMEKIQKRKKYL